ncbi:MAG TPA: DUF3857 domain-containing protein, partial [Ferruginibacter sp.]|nr:DUF3857 domain-containing protein [Ferruginibacter sp.]
MRIMQISMAGFLLAMSLNSNAQLSGLYGTKFTWNEKPALHGMPEKFKDASAVYLADNRIFLYKFEDKDLVQYNYVYKLVKVADDKGIEMFNKIYIPVYYNAEVNDIKARVINANGTIINVPASKIKDEEIEGNRYKFFAMEGLDKGSEIEYSYVTKKNPSYFGTETFQTKATPYANVKVSLVVPKHLKYDAMGFNGFTVLEDSVIGDYRVIAAYSDNIPELNDEKYGLRDPYLQRIDYKLSYNLSNNPNVKINTWNEMAKNVHKNLTTFSDKEKKAVNKFVNAADIPEGAKEETMIMLLEDHMKNKINIDDKLISENAENLEAAIKSGNTNNFGAARLLIAMLENKGIRYQVVFPSIRDQLPLVEDLENWNRVEEMMLYFPSTQKYLQPSSVVLRYPYVNPFWTATRGLYLKTTTIGDVTMAIAKFDTIPMIPFDQHAHNMEISVKQDATGDSLVVESKQIMRGYFATAYRPIWSYLTVDKQDEAIKEIITTVAKSENVQNIKVENTALTDIWTNKPLMLSGTIHTAELMDKAGNKLLFKIGELIGPQEQMYQEKPRQLPAEMEYPHVLHRTIKFQIPEGYTAKNLKDLNIDIGEKNGDEVSLGFTSKYTLTGNLLEVDVLETYHELKYPLAKFETFKNVINAAADFNKIV